MLGGGDAPAPLIVLGGFPYTDSTQNCDPNISYGVKLASIFDDGVTNFLLLFRDLQNDEKSPVQAFQGSGEDMGRQYSAICDGMPGVLAAAQCLSRLQEPEKTNSIQTGGAGISFNRFSSKPKGCMKTIHGMTSVSERGKQHACCLCGRSFAKRSKLRRHELTHTGKKPYICNVKGCRKSYSRKEHLSRHYYHVHDPNRK